MIEKLKQYWYVQYKIAAAKLFREFIGFLAKGGNQAVDFYNHNEHLVQALLANPHNTDSLDAISLKKLIAESLKQPVENQQWFFEHAKEKLNEVKRVLTEKYQGTLRYGQELGIDLSESTPESLWADLCGYKSEQEQPSPEQPSPEQPEQEQPSPEQSAAESEQEQLSPEQPAAEPEQEQPSPEPESAAEPEQEQRFKTQLSEMTGVGMSDAEIWEVVKDEAKALKLAKAKVLAELAEMRK
jgi:hypothetical protein